MAEIVTLEEFRSFASKVFEDLEEIKAGKSGETKNRWLKSGDVKSLLGVSHGKLQDLRDRGIIPFTKLGGLILYDRKEIEKLLINKGQSK